MERELKGPWAYDQFNEISRICQTRYLRLIGIQTGCLIVISLIGSFPYSKGDTEWWARHIIIAFSIGVLATTIYQQNKNYMKGWQNARFVAESVLSNAWLFAFSIGQYSGGDKEATKAFLDSLEKIDKEVELKQFLDLYSSDLPSIANWMSEVRDAPSMSARKELYIKYRLDDQIGWYRRKSAYNRGRATLWFFISLALIVIGIGLTFLIPLYDFSILGFVSTITASILTWRQTKRFDELKATYAVAASELRALKTRFELEKDAADILSFVEEAEKSISREHKLWFNWTYIS